MTVARMRQAGLGVVQQGAASYRSSALRTTTSIILIVISLAAVAGVAYGSYRASQQTTRLEKRVAALEQANTVSAKAIAQLRTDERVLCESVNRVREKITGVVLAPGSPTPNFDLQADPLGASDRIILMLYNWCNTR